MSLAKWGYFLGVLFPVGGFIIALVLFSRNEIGPGLAVLGCCFLGVMAAVYLATA